MTKPEQASYGHLFITHNINHPGVGARCSGQESNKGPKPLLRAGLLRDTPRAHLTPPPRPPTGSQMASPITLLQGVFLEGGGGSARPRRLSHLPSIHIRSQPLFGLQGEHPGPSWPQVCKSLKWGWQAPPEVWGQGRSLHNKCQAAQ